jgi:hypothetical protein
MTEARGMNITKPTTLVYEAGAAIYSGRIGTGSYVCDVAVAESTARQFGMTEIIGAISAYDGKLVRMWHA